MDKSAKSSQSDKAGAERRAYYRIPLRGKLLVKYQNEEFWLSTVNFGFGGVFLESDSRLEVGVRLTLGLEHDDSYAETSAQVIRRDELGFGVAFTDPSLEFSALLVQVMEPYLLAVKNKKSKKA